MLNYNAKYQTLVVRAEKERHNLRAALERVPCRELGITGTPDEIEAIRDFPAIEDISISRCRIDNLDALQGLPNLRRLSIAFGPFSGLDLEFCRETLEFLSLSYLKSLKDLSRMPICPRLERLTFYALHKFQPPDFNHFPRLKHLSIPNTDWKSLSWLEDLPALEDLHLWLTKVEDGDWTPLTRAPALKRVYGVQSSFKGKSRKDLMALCPDLRVDKPAAPDPSEIPARLRDKEEQIWMELT